MQIKRIFKSVAAVILILAIWVFPLSLYLIFIDGNNSSDKELQINIYSLGYIDGALNTLNNKDKSDYKSQKYKDSIQFVNKYLK